MNFTKSSSTKQIRNETPMSKANNKLMQAIKYLRSHLRSHIRSPPLAPFASAHIVRLRSASLTPFASAHIVHLYSAPLTPPCLCSYLRSHHDHHPQLPPPPTTACSFLRTFFHSYKQFWVFGALTTPAT